MHIIQNKYLIRTIYIVSAVSVFILCLVPGYLKIPYGVHTFDEPYQILNGMFPKHAPYAPLTAYITNWFGNLFNWEWIYFKYLAFGLHVLCIFITGGYLLYKTKKFLYSLVITCAALLIGSLIPTTFNLYGWDDWTQLLDVLLIFALWRYFSHPKAIQILIIAGLSALFVLFRIPNISIILIISLLLWFHNESHKLKHLTLFLITTLGILLLIIILIYGSPNNYIETFKDTPINGHNFINLIYNIGIGIFIIFLYMLLYKGFNDIYKNRIINKLRYKSVLLGSFIFCFFIYFTHYCENIFYFWTLAMDEALILYGACLIYSRNGWNLRSNICWKLTIALILANIPALGSNVGAIKSVIFPLFPIIGLFIYPHINNYYKTLAISIVLGTFFLVSFRLGKISFWDEGYRTTTYQLKYGKGKSLYTTPQKGKKIDNLIKVYSKYANKNNNQLILRLNNDYLWEYLFDARNNYLGSLFNYPNIHFDKDYIDWVEEQIVNSDKPVVILYQKHDTFETTDIPLLPMLQMIQKYLKPVEDIDGFLIYASPDAIVEDVNL